MSKSTRVPKLSLTMIHQKFVEIPAWKLLRFLNSQPQHSDARLPTLQCYSLIRKVLPKRIDETRDYEISLAHDSNVARLETFYQKGSKKYGTTQISTARDLNFVRLETFAKKVRQNPAYERAEFIRNKIYPHERHFSRRFSPWTEIFGKKAGLCPNRASPHTDRNTRVLTLDVGRPYKSCFV